jgi:GT2 family glycosyltransferase
MITIGFCTVDRKEPLEKNLEDLRKQNLDGLPEVELIVVMNNSTRGLHEIVDRLLPTLPFKCRKLEETRQGGNFGRNRIAEEARGEIVVYTDDDLLRDPNWTREMVRAFDDPQVSSVGGRIHPVLSCPLPSWYRPRYDGVIVRYDLGDKPFFLTLDNPMPYGASMAFRRKVLETLGPFRTDLSIRPGRAITGGETEYMIRAIRLGHRVLYSPAAVSYHPIDESRLTKANMRRQFRTWGTSWARMNFEGEKKAPQFAGAPRHLYRSMLEHAFRWLGAAVRLNEGDRFLHANEVVYCHEFIREFRRILREEAKT